MSNNPPLSTKNRSPSIAVARSLATALDTWRIDPILGLLPVVGDVICGVIGLIIVGIAAMHRVPKVTMARMLLNIAFDALLGSIPLIGDVLDFWFPAHTLNVRLLERADRERRASWTDYLILSLAVVACIAALVLPVVFGVWLVRWLLAQSG